LAKKTVAKKTAVKKTVSDPTPPPEFVKNFEDAQQNLKELQLSLRTLKKQLNCLCQHGYKQGPKQPKE
jgi:hypothetical protein